jgi:aminoglycoside phosphotransferase (APT) family kinase protein
LAAVTTPADDSTLRLGEGREAEILAWGDGYALRLLRDPGGRPRLEDEAAAMTAAAGAGVPVPAIHEIVVVAGRPGLLMDRVDGVDLLTDLERRPWRFAAVARELGGLQARLHGLVAPPGLPDLRTTLRDRIERAPHLEPRLRAAALSLLAGLPDGARLCHGDLHPGNVMATRRGLTILDWTNVAHGDAIGDLARTMLLLRVGQRPGMSALNRGLDRLGRGLFRRRWLRAYRRQRRIEPGLLERWETVNAAARLWEGMDEEVPTLIGLLEARTR